MTRDSFAVGTLIHLCFQNAGGDVINDISANVTGASDSAISLKTIEGVDGTMVFGGASIEVGTLLVFTFGADRPMGPWTEGGEGEVVVVGKVTDVYGGQVQMKTYRSADGFMDVGGEYLEPPHAHGCPFDEDEEP